MAHSKGPAPGLEDNGTSFLFRLILRAVGRLHQLAKENKRAGLCPEEILLCDRWTDPGSPGDELYPGWDILYPGLALLQ